MEICAALRCGLVGLRSDEARQRLDQYGPNSEATAQADALTPECTAFTAGEAPLTGEPYPVQKTCRADAATDPDDTSNALFRGSVAQTGEAIALAVKTGSATVFGTAASALAQAEG